MEQEEEEDDDDEEEEDDDDEDEEEEDEEEGDNELEFVPEDDEDDDYWDSQCFTEPRQLHHLRGTLCRWTCVCSSVLYFVSLRKLNLFG